MKRPLIIAAAALGALAFGAAPAAAATRYAASGSANVSGPCASVASACRLDYALNSASANDTVIIQGGTYNADTPGMNAIVTTVRLDIRGADGDRPIVTRSNNSANTIRLGTGSAGTTLKHLDLRATGADSYPLVAFERAQVSDIAATSNALCVQLIGDGSSIEDATLTVSPGGSSNYCLIMTGADLVARRLSVDADAVYEAANLDGGRGTYEDIHVTNRRATGSGLGLNGTSAGAATLRRASVDAGRFGIESDNALITDSVAHVTAPGGNALLVEETSAVKTRNVTAVASGDDSAGVKVVKTSNGTGASLEAKNSIFRGSAGDVLAEPGGHEDCLPSPFCPPGGVDYVAGSATLSNSNFRSSGPGITDAGGNQSGDPLFANGAAGDFHLSAGSPAIDAGASDPLNGPTDLDGRPRAIGAAPDIGAYELPSPPPPPDTTAPALTAASLTNKVFAVGRARTLVSARKRAKRGTKVRFTLSESATVTIKIQRKAAGRRKGRHCVKPTRRNRHAKRCTRWPAAGTLTRAGAAGPNIIAFSGRIGRKALRPGSYRARVRASDAAGNLSAQRTLTFRVVRR